MTAEEEFDSGLQHGVTGYYRASGSRGSGCVHCDLTSRFPFGMLLRTAEVAQLVEQRTENPRVASSILALGTIFLLE